MLNQGRQLELLPRADSMTLPTPAPLQLMQPRNPAISGVALAASVAVAESALGPAVTEAIAKPTLSGLFKV